jgi:hypothetical protein
MARGAGLPRRDRSRSLSRQRVLLAVAFLAAAFILALAWQRERVIEKVLYWRFGATLPQPSYPAPRDEAEARMQDLDYLSQLTRVDRSFAPHAAELFRQRIAALRARAASLDRTSFLLGVSEAVAAADNAHTNVDSRAWRQQLASVPVRFEWFAEGRHVVRARDASADLLGARIVAIDGFEPQRLVEDAARFFGGPKEFVRTSSLVYLESPEAIHAIHAEAPADRLQLRLVDGDGRERTVELAALPPPQRPEVSKAGRLLSPVPLPDEDAGEWRTVLDPKGPIPPSLRAPERSVYGVALDDGTLYLHLWQVRDDASGSVDDGIARAVGEGARWRRIVLDLRFDRGGDYPWAYSQIRRLPKHLATDGRILVLLDNTTFSAAIIDAALVKHFGAGRTTLIGEAPGDRLAFWAEGNSFVLPHSKLRILSSTGYHDWARGCRELRCYWPNFWYDVGVGNVDPDVRVAWSFSDYRRGVDTVLQRALER